VAGFQGVCLVEHPLVARILATECRVAYLHAEIAAPPVAAVPGIWRTLVPLEETHRRLVEAGGMQKGMTITGLVVEPELVTVAETAYRARLGRLSDSDTPVTVAFFTSGAYPKPHLVRTIVGVRSCLDSGHRVVVFGGTDAQKARRLRDRLPSGHSGLEFISPPDRATETTRTAGLFESVDVMVAAAHERTNWAVGLGLPMLALLPNIGPFAPLNYRFARDQGVCRPVRSVRNSVNLGRLLSRMKQAGELSSMAERGYGPHPIGGAAVAASAILAGSV
jgi:hypothetical protein